MSAWMILPAILWTFGAILTTMAGCEAENKDGVLVEFDGLFKRVAIAIDITFFWPLLAYHVWSNK